MSNTIVVGAQWGDEGKGKIVDYLTESADVIVRAQGGNNAGHTVIVGDKTYILHLIPSGILWPGKTCVIGNGVVLDPLSLWEEVTGLREKEIEVTPENLIISSAAHLVMPYHRRLDTRNESRLGSRKIGTTGRGIGPAYTDKAERTGFRVADLFDPVRFTEEVYARIAAHNETLAAAGQDLMAPEKTCAELLEVAEELKPFVKDSVPFLHRIQEAGKSMLFEGAQGTYLDIDHGTYPFVTSSNTTSGGACTGSGIPPNRIDRVVGVAKAYTTRVGEGPFVTENQEITAYLHGLGREFGATTGRPRRCGWFDSVLVRYAGMLNGLDGLALTNLDGLDEMETIKVCVAYELDGERIDVPPAATGALARCKPVYDDVPGWRTPTTSAKTLDDLPAAARAYLARVSELTNIPISLIGVGPDRRQLIVAECGD